MSRVFPMAEHVLTFDGIWQSFHSEYDMLAKHFKGIEVKMMEKCKFDTVEDDDDLDTDSPKRGRVD